MYAGCCPTADVDIFIYGLDEAGGKQLLLRLEQSFVQAADARNELEQEPNPAWKGRHEAAVIRTPHTVTFAMQVIACMYVDLDQKNTLQLGHECAIECECRFIDRFACCIFSLVSFRSSCVCTRRRQTSSRHLMWIAAVGHVLTYLSTYW